MAALGMADEWPMDGRLVALTEVSPQDGVPV